MSSVVGFSFYVMDVAAEVHVILENGIASATCAIVSVTMLFYGLCDIGRKFLCHRIRLIESS